MNELNSFYSTVACAHPPCLSSSLDAIVTPIQDIYDSALSFYEITTTEVYDTARMLSSKSKGQSPDGPLETSSKSTATTIAFFTENIELFDQLNTPQSVSNTRPITDLCHLAKVFDKIKATQSSQHLETHSLLSPFQFGFRSEYNTQSALLYFTAMIRYGIKNNLVTLATLFDFRRALDSIDHEALLLTRGTPGMRVLDSPTLAENTSF